MIKAVFGCRKTFSGKYIFSGNANFRKRKIFLCVWLHFKNFPENIFWCLEKKKENTNPRKISSTIASSRRRDLTIDLRLRSRDDAISRRQSRSEARARDHDLATARDCDLREIAPPGARTGDRCRLKLGLEIGAAWRSTDCSVSSPLSRAHALSLSLSLSLFPKML